MLMRSGSFAKPRPLVEFDCGSQSTSSVLTSAAASEAARLMAVVVLPTPPFWLATAMTRPMILFLWCCGQDMRTSLRNQHQILCKSRNVSRGTLRAPLYVVYGGGDEENWCVQFEKCFTWNVFISSHNETNSRVITTYHQLLDVKFALNIRVEAFLYNCFPLLLMHTN